MILPLRFHSFGVDSTSQKASNYGAISSENKIKNLSLFVCIHFNNSTNVHYPNLDVAMIRLHPLASSSSANACQMTWQVVG